MKQRSGRIAAIVALVAAAVVVARSPARRAECPGARGSPRGAAARRCGRLGRGDSTRRRPTARGGGCGAVLDRRRDRAGRPGSGSTSSSCSSSPPGFFAAASRRAFRAAATRAGVVAAAQRPSCPRAPAPGDPADEPEIGRRQGRAVRPRGAKRGGGGSSRWCSGPATTCGRWRSEAARSADVIGMAGGDGSQALVAQVAMEHDLPYVCVPAGTRNHLALDLGLDRDDVVGALDAFIDGGERRIDLAFVNDRIFVNNVSLGIYAEIVQSEAYRDAKLADRRDDAARPARARTRRPSTCASVGPTAREQETAQLVLVSNNRYVLDRLGAIGSRPRLDSGQLGIVAVEIANAAQAAELVSLSALGQVSRFDGLARVDGVGVRSRLERAGRDGHRRRGGRPRTAAPLHHRPGRAHRALAARSRRPLARGAPARLHQLDARRALAARGGPRAVGAHGAMSIERCSSPGFARHV